MEMKQLSVPASVPQDPELPVAFVELKPTPVNSESASMFQPDLVIRKGQLVLEISNSAFPELLSQLGGLLHAQ